MNDERANRKLTAILSADVKGYSRLMGDDELATIETLKKYRETISSLIEGYKGRVVDSPGDNILSEFGSVVDAVECAVKIQEDLKKENEELPEKRKMEFRIGVNLGDVVEDDGRIYGDGVNIAARIEGLADGGGICISRTAYDQVKNKLSLGYEYLGEHSVKNIKDHVRVYRLLPDAEEKGSVVYKRRRDDPRCRRRAAVIALILLIVAIIAFLAWNFYFRSTFEPASVDKMAYSLPDKPSIAVLPFDNMSGDPEQDYIGDGLAENIISALSVSSNIFVIARNTTFTYKGKPIKIKQLAEDLGVQYVLEGSIQRSGDRLRVTAQLIDALTGHHLWTDKYDREMKELFDLQDEITKKIVVSLHIKLTGDEDVRVYAKSTENLEAWENLIKGIELFDTYIKEDNAKAQEFFKAALEIEPECVSAMTHLAGTYMKDGVFRWSDTPLKVRLKQTFELLQKVMELDEQYAFAHAMLVTFYLYKRQLEKALAEGERAIALNPNFALGYARLAQAKYYNGQFDEVINLMEKNHRLDPNYLPTWLVFICKSYIHLGRYEEALEVAKQIEGHAIKRELPPQLSSTLFSWIYHELGKEEEARTYMAKGLQIKPNMSIEQVKRGNPFKNPVHLQRELDAYRKAGMPEKVRGAVKEKPSIAVLPFENISGDEEQEYFSDGMTEELIGALAKVEGLKVISRTSAFYFKGKDFDLRTIGEKLKVDNVLEGSVRKAGNKLRISAQLIKVADDSHLWSETYEHELKNIFDIQDEISRAVVQNLKVKLLGTETERLVKDYTKNTEAYELYLKGKYIWNKKFLLGFEEAMEYFKKAIEADPNYVPAYNQLAVIYAVRMTVQSLEPWETGQKRDSLLKKALEIDDQYGPTYSALGMTKFAEYDWESARTYFKRGLELNPGSPYSHFAYSNYLSVRNRMDEAIAEMRRAVELDPLSGVWRELLARTLAQDKQFDQAIEVLQEFLEFDPNNFRAQPGLGYVYGAMGMYDKAISILQRYRSIPGHAANLGYCYAKAGKKEEAQKILDDFLNREKKGYFSPYRIAILHVGLGDKDKAFEYLDKAYEYRDFAQLGFTRVHFFTELHSTPRWMEQLKKRGLAG